jgi:hypothetical protein
MRTGIATAIFLVSVTLTLFLYYYLFVRKGDALKFIESNTSLVLYTLTALIFFVTLIFGIKIMLLFLAFLFLYYFLLLNR